MEYEAVIGLEVHSQLLTRSKMFCGCSTEYQEAAPNTHVCPVCLGMPGTLPVINRHAVEYTIMTGLALNCTINAHTKFDRKNYPYPDLMKGYQISQYDQPLCSMGWLPIEVDGVSKRPRITRVHLEEDTARLTHRNAGGEAYSLVDVNRSGIPLMEIVGEPDLRSAEEARQYLMNLRRILQYLGICSGNMEEGAFRCDANVSIRPAGSKEFGTKVEIKNMNSFRSVYRAIEFEIERQKQVLESGGRVVQETRGWVDARNETVSQRSKEQAHDYRYFPEPDLPPLVIDPAWVEGIKQRLPELPDARRDRFVRQYGLPQYDAEVLTSTAAMARFFEATVEERLRSQNGSGSAGLGQVAKVVSNWCQGEFSRLLNQHNLEPEASKVTPSGLAQLIDLVESGKISQTSGKTVFEEHFETGAPPEQIVERRGLVQISGSEELDGIVTEVLATHPQAVADYAAGKAQAMGFLVGQVMRQTRGRANPATVTGLLR